MTSALAILSTGLVLIGVILWRWARPANRHSESDQGVEPARFLDLDGYAQFLLEDDPKYRSEEFSTEDANLSELSLLHYMLRSSMLLTFEAGEVERESLRQHSEGCLATAIASVGYFVASTKLPPPGWATFFHDAIEESLRANYPSITDISIEATFDDRLYARSFPNQKRILLSAFTYEYLRTVNLILWTHTLNTSEGLVEPAAIEKLPVLEDLLPFILAVHGDTNYSALPIIRARDRKTLTLAKRVTQIQLTFMLAHEYAHILLDHDVATAGTDGLESEADMFAINLLTRLSWTDQEISVGDIWIACAWLFEFLGLDRIVGLMMSGDLIEWDQVTIDERLDAVNNRLRAVGEVISSTQEELKETGISLLLSARRDLFRAGPDFVKRYANDYFERFGVETLRQQRIDNGCKT